MNLRTFLELGRSSNLPTVLTNAITGGVLASVGLPEPEITGALVYAGVACSLLYLGGMFLNDAFDAPWDRSHRPTRPIPRGAVSRGEVFGYGFALLFAGLGVVTIGAPPGQRAWPVFQACVFTVFAIVVYNRWHKGFGFAPWVMGACRMGVVAIGALLVNPAPQDMVSTAAFAIGAYVVGLTHVASFETKERVGRRFIAWLSFVPALVIGVDMIRSPYSHWQLLTLVTLAVQVAWATYLIRGVKLGTPGSIPRAVTGLIAGLSLVDAAFVSRVEPLPWVLVCWAFFPLTLIWQRRIAGT